MCVCVCVCFNIGNPQRDLHFFKFIYLLILFLHMSMFPICCFRQRTCMAHDLLNEILNET